MRTMKTDYLVIGAGATEMALSDALVAVTRPTATGMMPIRSCA